MNILFVVPWDQEYGGITSVVGNLASHLNWKKHKTVFLYPGKSRLLKAKKTKLGFSGYELTLIDPVRENHTLIGVFIFIAFFPSTLFQVLYILLKHKIQIVNIHYAVGNFIYLALLRCILPIKLITSIHGADFFPGGKSRRRYLASRRFLLTLSDFIIAPSRAFLNEFLNIFPHLKKKSTYIHNCVDVSKFRLPVKEKNNSYKGRYILCIAAHNEKKGIDVLLHAFSILRNTDPLLELFLVGDGPLRRKLERLAYSLNISAQTRFIGEKGRAEIVRLMNDCEIFVLPSRSEPFGIVVIEALACKKPVVASAVGGIPEIIENGKNGLLVPPDDPAVLAQALKTLIEDDGLRSRIAVNGHKTVLERFCCEKNGSAYEKLFNILNSNKNIEKATPN